MLMSGVNKLLLFLPLLMFITILPGAVDGGWTTWTKWTQCTESRYCLRGSTSRTRKCFNPPPQNGGDECGGLGVEKKDCPTPEQGCQGKDMVF